MADQSLLRFRMVVAHAVFHLENRCQDVNNLNVFPVADGDTGDNMLLTLKAVVDELDRLNTALPGNDPSLDKIGRDTIVQSVARAALLGARGNSGVILSQFIRGAAQELISRPGELVDPVLVSAAMARAADAAYAAVRNPAEGTMLTTMREMASTAASLLAHEPFTRFTEDFAPENQNIVLGAFLEKVLATGIASVEHSPELLPALKEAGVVDSGAYALTIIFAAVVESLTTGKTKAAIVPRYQAQVDSSNFPSPIVENTDFRYCVNIAVTGEDLDLNQTRSMLEPHGNSILVVGDSATLRIHIHSDDPETVRELLTENTQHILRFEATDMDQQVRKRSEKLQCESSQPIHRQPKNTHVTCAVLAVVNGDGMHRLYAELGAHTIDGGPTFNPSTADLISAIEKIQAAEILLLSNSKNVWLAAEQASKISDKPVTIIQSTAPQAGLAAAVTFDANQSAEKNSELLNNSLSVIDTASVAPAARDDIHGRFQEGDAVGFINDSLIGWGSAAETLLRVVNQLSQSGAELVTCISGNSAPLTATETQAILAELPVEYEYHHGDQATYWWLMSAE